MRILLIRHGESHANVDTNVHRIIPDHEIALSSRGEEQAKRAGEYVKAYFEKEYADYFDNNLSVKEKANKNLEKMLSESGFGKNKQFLDIFKELINKVGTEDQLSEHLIPKIRLYHSPYRRTRATADCILESCKSIITDVKENFLLAEQTFGIFDGLEDDVQKERFPAEFAYFQHAQKYNGKFWARYPLGESPSDVAVRLKVFFQQLKEDEENGIKDAVIVCHGTVLRVFTMAWFNHTPEWYAEEKSPGNCAIRIIDNYKDLGYYFGGYRNGMAWEYKKNPYD